MFRATCFLVLSAACLAGCSSGDTGGGSTAEAVPPAAAGAAADAAATDAGWITLFDGSSLDAFSRVGDANWSVADGAVRADAGAGHLVTNGSYGDFELRVEFWVSEDANSGVFIRCADRQQIDPENCYEINIFDQRPDPTYRTGAIVDVVPPASRIDTGGRWNSYEISARGPRLSITLNGMPMVDVEDERLREGPVTLQYGAGTVMFRNVQIRTL